MLKNIAGLLGLFITLPIWFFLMYRILEAVHATELTWFLYWVYVPVAILVNVLAKIGDGK